MIYLDNASTTKCSKRTLEIANKYFEFDFFNPSSTYKQSVNIKTTINNCRNDILNMLKGDGKVIFTSSGTESDVTSLLGSKKKPGSKILISSLEHSAIYETSLELKKRGFEVVFCPVDSSGKIVLEKYLEALDQNVSLISIIHVNNETGAINDIKKLVELAKSVSKSIIFHSDGVQAVGKIDVDLTDLGVDLYSFSAHKIGGLKGCAALFIKNNINISPLLFGGGQEFNLRPSTENVAGIVSMTEAIKEKTLNLNNNYSIIYNIFQDLLGFFTSIDGISLISNKFGSPYIISCTSKYIRGEVMQHILENDNILIGTGSACSSNKKLKRSAEALGLNGKLGEGLIRISLSSETTFEEINQFKNIYLEKYQEYKKYAN